MDEAEEFAEEAVGVVRTGSGFGMELDAEDGLVTQAEAFEGAIVEAEVGKLDALRIEGGGVDDVVVVLGGDEGLTGGEVLDGMVAAMVAEL